MNSKSTEKTTVTVTLRGLDSVLRQMAERDELSLSRFLTRLVRKEARRRKLIDQPS